MLSDKVSAVELLSFIDQLKAVKRSFPNSDIIRYINRFLELLFKTPVIPTDALESCAHQLYDELISLSGAAAEDVSVAWVEYNNLCKNNTNYDNLTNAVNRLEDAQRDGKSINDMIESLEKLFGFSVDIPYDYTIFDL